MEKCQFKKKTTPFFSRIYFWHQWPLFNNISTGRRQRELWKDTWERYRAEDGTLKSAAL